MSKNEMSDFFFASNVISLRYHAGDSVLSFSFTLEQYFQIMAADNAHEKKKP